MSTDIAIIQGCAEEGDKELKVTSFCGAAMHGQDRSRVQLTTEYDFARLDRAGTKKLVKALVRCFGKDILPFKED